MRSLTTLTLTLMLSLIAVAAGRPASLQAAPAPLASLTIQTSSLEHAPLGVVMGGAAGGVVMSTGEEIPGQQ
jgi:hypothetical protein